MDIPTTLPGNQSPGSIEGINNRLLMIIQCRRLLNISTNYD